MFSLCSQNTVGCEAAHGKMKGVPTTASGRLAPRRVVAVNVARLAGLAARAVGRGGGTALPGLVGTKIDPHLVADLSGQLAGGSIVVSGTNGKTTTSRMLDTILRHAGQHPLRNSSGSNLMR